MALGAGCILADVIEKAMGEINPLKSMMGDGTNTVLGASSILFNIAEEVVGALEPLKATLGVISTIYGN